MVKFPAKIFPIQSETKDNKENFNGLELREIENGKKIEFFDSYSFADDQ